MNLIEKIFFISLVVALIVSIVIGVFFGANTGFMCLFAFLCIIIALSMTQM